VSGDIHVRGLRAGFGRQQILCGIDVTACEREVLAVIGRSGCGKSTFIRCLNRMHELVPSAWVKGSVELSGVDIYGPSVDPVRLRRRVGMVFQRPSLFPTMSIRDNILSGLKLTGRLVSSEASSIIERVLKQTVLWDEVRDRLGQRGSRLSVGQQQRLCIARALAVQPQVLLMDEPCSSLDPIATARIEDLIDALRGQYTIILVTHSLQQAARVSDRTAFFHEGELIETGLTGNLFTSPQDQRTEDYITGRYG
jgi:phosphate transport system ATP-binding protein